MSTLYLCRTLVTMLLSALRGRTLDGRSSTHASLLSPAPQHLCRAKLPHTRWQTLPPSINKQLQQTRAAQAIGASDSSDDRPKLTSIFHVFSDPKCNRKLLALAIGQMLCSVATLIHDSYLPVYVQDELGLSNTKVCIPKLKI